MTAALQHLSPEYHRELADELSQHTALAVSATTDGAVLLRGRCSSIALIPSGTAPPYTPKP